MVLLPILFLLSVALSQVAAEVEFATTVPISRNGEVAGDEEYRLKFPLDTQTLLSKSLLVKSKLLEAASEPRRISVTVRHSSGQSQWDLDSKER